MSGQGEQSQSRTKAEGFIRPDDEREVELMVLSVYFRVHNYLSDTCAMTVGGYVGLVLTKDYLTH